MKPAPPPPPPWRRLLRHAITLLLIATYCAFVAPTVATVLIALRANGLTAELPAVLMLAPLTILFAGPGAFLLGLVFGWMLLVMAANGINRLDARIALAVLIASLAWWLADPLPQPDTANDAGDWLIWAVTAALSALLFTQRWVTRRMTHPVDISDV